MDRIGHDRILFGTGLPIEGAAPYAKWNRAKLCSSIHDPVALDAILGRNALRLIESVP